MRPDTGSQDSAGRSGGTPEERFVEMRPALARSLERVCPPWLANQKDDILQEASLKMLDVLRSGGAERELNASYARSVAYSAVVDEIRRRRGREITTQGDVLDGATRSPRPGPEGELRRRELGRAIFECLAMLGRPRRLAVALHLYGYDRAESTTLLRWPAKRVDNLRYRGLADLRLCLEGKGVAP